MFIAHLDAFCDRASAEALKQLGGTRRHARAGARSQTEAAIEGQDMRLAKRQTRRCDQACKYILDIVIKGDADGVAVGYVENEI